MKTKFLIIATVTILLNVAWIKPGEVAATKLLHHKTVVNKAGNFSFFRTHRQGRNGIAATWAVNSSQGLTGFVLQRTYEYPDEYANWENVYDVNCSGGNSYGYVDGDVFPGEISYRVLAMNGTSVAFVSAISAVQIRQR
jgi:hypothetical protein